ncbi:MAG: methyltransferase domain-containing protein [Fibrobacteria bacterium]
MHLDTTRIEAKPANANQALWEKGDFTEIAATMREAGEALVRDLGVTASMRVLDLGCGDGTTALPLAETGARVIGIDIARNLVAAGNRRAAAAGLVNLSFSEGDACQLEGVPDQAFDLSLTVFGAMFAPKPFEVAKELVRVTRKGGRIVMGNWIAGDPSFVSQVLKISATYTPSPPEGFISPVAWGVENHILDRFGKAGIAADRISMSRETYRFISPGKTPAQFIDTFRRFYGPTMNAYDAALKDGREADLHRELVALAESRNEDRRGGLDVPATYMRVTVFV